MARQSFKHQRECCYSIVINGIPYAAFRHLNDAVDWAEHRYWHYQPYVRCAIKIIDTYGDEFYKSAWPAAGHRSKHMKWDRDGDLWVTYGSLGTYEIHERCLASGSRFIPKFYRGPLDKPKALGEFSTLENAKSAAETYDGYRAA